MKANLYIRVQMSDPTHNPTCNPTLNPTSNPTPSDKFHFKTLNCYAFSFIIPVIQAIGLHPLEPR